VRTLLPFAPAKAGAQSHGPRPLVSRFRGNERSELLPLGLIPAKAGTGMNGVRCYCWRLPSRKRQRERMRTDANDPKRTKAGLKSRSAAASCHIVCRHGRGRHSAPPRLRTIQFGPTKCVNNSTDLRCKSGRVCAGLVMPTVNLTRVLSEAGGISSVGIRMSSVGIRLSSVSTSVSSTIDPADLPTVGSIILCISM